VSDPCSKDQLTALRHAIDGIDEAICGLLATRIALSHQAQEIKLRNRIPTHDPQREIEIQQRYERRWCGASTVARSILNLCRED
jgi:chorismate mutase